MQSFFFIHVKRKYIRIDFSEIQYILCVGHYVKIVTDSAIYMPLLNLKQFAEVLPAAEFAQVNRSTIVALKRVTHFDTRQVVIKNQAFSFTDRFRKEFESRLVVMLHVETPREGKPWQVSSEKGLIQNGLS